MRVAAVMVDSSGAEEAPELNEPYCLVDTVVQGLAEVEMLAGGWARFVFYCVHRGHREVVLRLVMPLEAVAPARQVVDAEVARARGMMVS